MNTYQEDDDEEDDEDVVNNADDGGDGAFHRGSVSPELPMDFSMDRGGPVVEGRHEDEGEGLHSGGMVSDAASLLFILGGAKPE